MSMLKQEYKEEEIQLADAKKLAIRVLSKTLDMTKLTSEKGEHPADRECFKSSMLCFSARWPRHYIIEYITISRNVVDVTTIFGNCKESDN